MYHKKIYLLLFMLVWLCGCLKAPHTLPHKETHKPRFSIDDAKAVYNKTNQNLSTRSDGERGEMYAGELDLWWEGAESLIYSGAYKEFDISNKEHQKWYVDIIENLRKIHSYSEYSERENCRSFVNIKELTEDCIESWEGMFY